MPVLTFHDVAVSEGYLPIACRREDQGVIDSLLVWLLGVRLLNRSIAAFTVPLIKLSHAERSLRAAR